MLFERETINLAIRYNTVNILYDDRRLFVRYCKFYPLACWQVGGNKGDTPRSLYRSKNTHYWHSIRQRLPKRYQQVSFSPAKRLSNSAAVIDKCLDEIRASLIWQIRGVERVPLLLLLPGKGLIDVGRKARFLYCFLLLSQRGRTRLLPKDSIRPVFRINYPLLQRVSGKIEFVVFFSMVRCEGASIGR